MVIWSNGDEQEVVLSCLVEKPVVTTGYLCSDTSLGCLYFIKLS